MRSEGLSSKLAGDAAVVLSLKIAGALAALGLHWLVARTYGPAGTGAFFFALTTATLLALVARMGIENQVVRKAAPAFAAADYPLISDLFRCANKLLVFTIAVICAGVAVGFALVQLGWLRLGIGETAAALAIVLAFPAIALTLGNVEFLRAAGKVAWYQGLNGLMTPLIALSGIAIALLLAEIDIQVAALLYVGAAVVTAAVTLALTRRTAGRSAAAGCLTPSKLARGSRELFVISLTAALTDWVMMLLLARFVAPEAVGIYSTAARIALVVALVLASVNVAAAPRFAVLNAQGQRAALQASARHARDLLLMAGLPLVVVLVAFADWIVLAFGAGFLASADVLRVLLAGHLVSLMVGPVGNLLLMSGNERPLVWIAMGCTLMMVVLGFLLLPTYGALGAAMVACATLIARNVLAAVVVWRRLGINMFVPATT